MSDDFCELIDLIVSHDNLRLNFQGICRNGFIRAKGIKTKFKESTPGHWVTEAGLEVEWIPPDDFHELTLMKVENSLVLSGTRYWSGTETIPQLKEWTSVMFPDSDLTKLKQQVEATLIQTQAPLHPAKEPGQEEWLSRKAASRYLSKLGCPCEPKTLANMAHQKKGPRFQRSDGGSIRYSRQILEQWAKDRYRYKN